MPLLDVRNLTIELDTPHGRVRALEKVSLTLNAGEIHGLVGESGSGRSLLARAILGIPGPNWTITADRMMWDGNNLMAMSSKERRNLMGSDMAMIFQDPSGSLDPAQTVGSQLMQAMPKNPSAYFWQRRRHARLTAQKWLHKVGIKNPRQVMSSYAWELSEGECQKVMIAMAVAAEPKQLWVVPGAGHVDLYRFAPQAYEAQVFGFLSRYLQKQ